MEIYKSISNNFLELFLPISHVYHGNENLK